MNPTEFTAARGAAESKFETEYQKAKQRYKDALAGAKSTTDRAQQCVRISDALKANKDLTTLVGDFSRLGDEGGCTLSPANARKLRADIEKYKSQYVEIQQGRDRLYSLQTSYADADAQATHVEGVNLFYFIAIGIALIVLVFLVLGSGVSSVFNAQPISAVVPRSLT